MKHPGPPWKGWLSIHMESLMEAVHPKFGSRNEVSLMSSRPNGGLDHIEATESDIISIPNPGM
jgi:hypothetical protein